MKFDVMTVLVVTGGAFVGMLVAAKVLELLKIEQAEGLGLDDAVSALVVALVIIGVTQVV